MELATVFDPTLATSGSFNAALPNGGKLLIVNDSSINLQLKFSNGFSTAVLSSAARLYCLSLPSPIVHWSALNSLSPGVQQVQQVLVEVFAPNEKIVETYPITIPRQIAVNNAIVMSAVNSLQNDGNVGGTQFIESTVSGDSQSSVSVTNDATAVFGSNAHPAVFTVRTGSFQLGNNVHVRAANSANVQRPILWADPANNLNVQALDNNQVIVSDFSGTNIAAFTTALLSVFGAVAASEVVFTVGSLARVSVVSGSGNGAFNHGLGKAPDIVLPIATAGTTAIPSCGGYTATQFTLNGVGYTTWKALCICLTV
jgi:hypothetical protein